MSTSPKLKPLVIVAMIFATVAPFGGSANAATPAAPAEAGSAAKKAEPIEIKAAEAKDHLGHVVVVTCEVSDLKEFPGGMILLNLDGKFPHQALTAVVREADATKVGDVKKYLGKKARIQGEVVLFNNRPEIVIKTADSISAK